MNTRAICISPQRHGLLRRKHRLPPGPLPRIRVESHIPSALITPWARMRGSKEPRAHHQISPLRQLALMTHTAHDGRKSRNAMPSCHARDSRAVGRCQHARTAPTASAARMPPKCPERCGRSQPRQPPSSFNGPPNIATLARPLNRETRKQGQIKGDRRQAMACTGSRRPAAQDGDENDQQWHAEDRGLRREPAAQPATIGSCPLLHAAHPPRQKATIPAASVGTKAPIVTQAAMAGAAVGLAGRLLTSHPPIQTPRARP